MKQIRINLKSSGEGTLQCRGLGTFQCLGRPGFPYRKDITIDENSKQRIHYSVEYGGYAMHYSILIQGSKGAYIHQGANNIKDNGGVSAGCIHLQKSDAQKVYNWVDQPVRILTTASWI